VLNGVTIIDDYAHHPQEIEATLVAAKVCEHNKVWCIFQPHTYTRTKALLDDFAVALAKADEIILADIYAARETDTLGISSQTLADKIAEQGASVRYLESFDKIKQYALEHCEKGDILITMGAGDVVKIGEDLLANK
jgi:UDP-N-acetylmuramate--alanine ligase